MSTYRGLICDYGGVLTGGVGSSFRAFERAEGLPKGTLFEVIGEAYASAEGDSPIVRFETGDASPDEFGRAMAAHLRERGHDVASEGIVQRIFAGTEHDPDMWEVVGRIHGHGVRTALLSNSWGVDGYPVERLESVFETLVISGEVGLRKPDPEIYRLTAKRLDLPADECVFIDDLDRNVEAAEQVGMLGIHHTDLTVTVEALEDAFGLDLRQAEHP